MITEDEKAMINYLRTYYSDDTRYSEFFKGNFVSCDNFLRYWEKAKSSILGDAFHDSLILRKPVNITVPDDDLLYDMRDKVFRCSPSHDSLCCDLREKLFKVNPDIYERNINKDSGYKMSVAEIIADYLFTCEAWVDNYYDGPTIEINLPAGGSYKLVHGCKVMKAIGRLVKGTNDSELINTFEEMRLAQSVIMNDSRINAELCLSIHPLDYMTASYNDCGWRSCMCWEDGEFRRGVIEMMNSPYVIVAYIQSSKDTLPIGNNHSWNSKRWREFFIVRPEFFITGIKGYPYWNRSLEDEVLNWLRELYASESSAGIYSWRYGEDCIDTKRDVSAALRFQCGPAMYNDFYSDNTYHTILLADKLNDKFIWTDYSGVSECVCCGEENNFDGEGDVICNECVTRYTCCKCGDSIYDTSELIEYNGEIFCRYCFDNLEECDCCGAKVDTDVLENEYEYCIGADDSTPLYIDKHSEQPIIIKLCPDCAEKVFVLGIQEDNEEHKLFSDKHYWWAPQYPIVPINRVSDYGKKYLNKNFDF